MAESGVPNEASVVKTVLPITLGTLGLVQHLVYARFLHRGVHIVETIRPLIKHAIIGGAMFLVHSIARSICSYLLAEKILAPNPTPYWICALLESPYVFGFVLPAAANTVLVAEHFRMSVLSFATTMKSRQGRLENRHKKSIEKSMSMAWLLGSILAGSFVVTALLQREYSPHTDHQLPSMASCSLLAVVPEPILCAVVVLFLTIESITSLAFLAVSNRGCFAPGDSPDVNRAQTDLRSRFRLMSDYAWWRILSPGILLHKGLVLTTLISILLAEYLEWFGWPPAGLEWSTLCTIGAQINLILPISIHMCRDVHFRTWCRQFGARGARMMARGIRRSENRTEEERF